MLSVKGGSALVSARLKGGHPSAPEVLALPVAPQHHTELSEDYRLKQRT